MIDTFTDLFKTLYKSLNFSCGAFKQYTVLNKWNAGRSHFLGALSSKFLDA